MNNLIFQRIIPQYRVPVFKKLYEKLGVIVCHSREKTGGSLKSAFKNVDFPTEMIPRLYIGGKETAALQNVVKPILKFRPNVIITELSLAYASFWLLLFFKKFFRYKLIYWTHGVNNDEIFRPFQSKKGKLITLLYRYADAAICYSESRAQLLKENLANCPPVFVAHNTIETADFLKLYDELLKKGKTAVRAELDWKEKFHLVYIGRLTKGKRIDLLLESFKELLKYEPDAALHIIGDGPEKVLLKSEIPHVYYHGEIWDEAVNGTMLFAADFCFNPGYVGLSIVHSFSMGTPMITCETTESGPFHSPEIDYLEDGKNGIFCENDALKIAMKIKEILKETTIEKLSENAHRTAVEKCSPENMLAGFKAAIEYCSK